MLAPMRRSASRNPFPLLYRRRVTCPAQFWRRTRDDPPWLGRIAGIGVEARGLDAGDGASLVILRHVAADADRADDVAARCG